MREAKRQARKLNFLISQTELYSHFIGSKLKTAEMEESEETAGSSKIIDPNAQPSDATVPPIDPHSDLADAEARLAELDDIDFDDDDESNLRAHAARNVKRLCVSPRKRHRPSMLQQRRSADATKLLLANVTAKMLALASRSRRRTWARHLTPTI